jgi:hypothetical protein
MEKDQKNIDQLFHRNIEGAGEHPPAFIWDNIADALDENAENRRVRKLEKRRRYSIALVLLVMVGSAALLLETAKETTGKKLVSGSPVASEKPSSVNSTAIIPAVTDPIQNSIT